MLSDGSGGEAKLVTVSVPAALSWGSRCEAIAPPHARAPGARRTAGGHVSLTVRRQKVTVASLEQVVVLPASQTL